MVTNGWCRPPCCHRIYNVHFHCNSFFFKGHQDIQDEAKFAILVASTLAGFAGYTVLKLTSKREEESIKIEIKNKK